MGRGSQAANTAATSAQNLSNSEENNSAALFGELAPTLEAQMANPTGLTPREKSDMNTAAQQSAGGSQAAAVGQGALLASRTRNAGAADAAIAQSTQKAGQQLSNAGLKTEMADANLKNQNEHAAEGGLEGMYNEANNAGISALGIVPQAVNANTQATNASYDWATDLLDPVMGAAGGGLGAYWGAQNRGGCWIAEAIYGTEDPRTHLVRAWLNGPFRKTLLGAFVMRIYLRIGLRVAWIARRSDLVKQTLKPLFDCALRRALND